MTSHPFRVSVPRRPRFKSNLPTTRKAVQERKEAACCWPQPVIRRGRLRFVIKQHPAFSAVSKTNSSASVS